MTGTAEKDTQLDDLGVLQVAVELRMPANVEGGLSRGSRENDVLCVAAIPAGPARLTRRREIPAFLATGWASRRLAVSLVNMSEVLLPLKKRSRLA